MYDESAAFYDAIYGWKDYEAESKRLLAEIAKRTPDAKSLLDVACGTGRHLELLSGTFEVEGVDLSPEMLAIARQRLRHVPLHEADMRSFELDRRFDVVTCLFGSIALLQVIDEARNAVRNMMRHLAPGGLLIIEPWVREEDFENGRMDVETYDTSDGHVLIGSVARRQDRLAMLDIQYLLVRSDGVRHVSEPLQPALWTQAEYAALLSDEGLRVDYDPDGLMGRGLLIATNASGG
ncbi:MAG: methyltransferase domain-containing protein [Actinomycetota bacterium]|nr:methyltransferase domain-containing protein [Actinomycetota bacterium]